MDSSHLNLAGQGHRIINFIVDMVSVSVIWLILSIVIMLIGFNQTMIDETGEELPIAPLVIVIPTFWGYYLLAEYKFQRTLGKLITRTRVVTSTGDKPTFSQILVRTLSRSIPFEYLSFLVTVQGVHDRLSKTRVNKK